MNKVTQIIGLDVGRGFTKAYTYIDDKEIESVIQSCYTLVFDKTADFSKCETDSFYFESGEDGYVVGEKCHDIGIIRKSDSDDKTSPVVEVMVQASLAKVAKSGNIIICLGIPNGLYSSNDAVEKIQSFYENKEYKLKYNGEEKNIKIVGCYCFREADAVNWLPEVTEFLGSDTEYAIASIGFRTIEKSYYNNGLFNVDKSGSSEEGNIHYLKMVSNSLKEGFENDIYALDISQDEEYVKRKNKVYRDFVRNAKESISYGWVKKDKIKIIVTGGLVEKVNLTKEMLPDNFYIVSNPVTASARGLYNFAALALKEDSNERD